MNEDTIFEFSVVCEHLRHADLRYVSFSYTKELGSWYELPAVIDGDGPMRLKNPAGDTVFSTSESKPAWLIKRNHEYQFIREGEPPVWFRLFCGNNRQPHYVPATLARGFYDVVAYYGTNSIVARFTKGGTTDTDYWEIIKESIHQGEQETLEAIVIPFVKKLFTFHLAILSFNEIPGLYSYELESDLGNVLWDMMSESNGSVACFDCTLRNFAEITDRLKYPWRKGARELLMSTSIFGELPWNNEEN